MFRGPDARAHDKAPARDGGQHEAGRKHRTRSRVSEDPTVLPSGPNLPARRPTRIARPEEEPRHVPRLRRVLISLRATRSLDGLA